MCLGWRSSLTVSPQTITERPSAKILKPSTNRLTTAFSSRWWSVWQFGHCQRSCNLSSTFLTWQMQHNFDDGKNVSTLTSVRPYHLHLYSSMRMKSPNPASEITRAEHRVRSVLAGWLLRSEKPHARRSDAPPPATAARGGAAGTFLVSRHGWHAGLVPFRSRRRARLARISCSAARQGHFLPARRSDQRCHLGALALPPHSVCWLSRRRPAVVFHRVLHGHGAGNQLSLRLDAPEIRQRLDRHAPARQPQSICAGLFRRADAPHPRYGPVDHRIRLRPCARRPRRRHCFLCKARRTPGAT